MHNITKITLLTLFIPTVTFAVTCAPTDTICRTKQNQFLLIKNTGIKPTEVAKASTTTETSDDQKNASKQSTDRQPFKIPFPPFASKPMTTSNNNTDQDTNNEAPKPQAGSTTLNIFAPTTDASNSTTNKPNQTDQKQEPASTSIQPTGMQYR
ncbi:MAG: hypothetical protein KKE11_03435 [Gammaproteobacteria bacterium]|nr:hypothetical protein [Gammaproteobacteria bacterium]